MSMHSRPVFAAAAALTALAAATACAAPGMAPPTPLAAASHTEGRHLCRSAAATVAKDSRCSSLVGRLAAGRVRAPATNKHTHAREHHSRPNTYESSGRTAPEVNPQHVGSLDMAAAPAVRQPSGSAAVPPAQPVSHMPALPPRHCQAPRTAASRCAQPARHRQLGTEDALCLGLRGCPRCSTCQSRLHDADRRSPGPLVL